MKGVEALESWLDKQHQALLDFLSAFISYPSTQGQEEEVQKNFLLPFLKEEMKWSTVKTITVDPEKKRPNINACLNGTGRGKSLLLNGHCDVVVVPPIQQEKWQGDPWQATCREGRVYGRGAVDMKGPITAMIWALKGLMELGIQLEGDLMLGLVIGEETSEQHLGVIPSTQDFLTQREGIDFALNLEPTGLEIHTVSNGNFDFSIQIQGQEIHTCMKMLADYPQRHGIPMGEEVGLDASQVLAELLRRFKMLEHRWNMIYHHPVLGGGGHPLPLDRQGSGNTSLNCTIIQAGSYLGSLPGNASLEGQVYYPPHASPEILMEEMEEVAQGLSLAFPGLKKKDITFTFCQRWHWKPFNTPMDHWGCKILAETLAAMGQRPIFSGMKSVLDNTYIQELGIPVVSFGPGCLWDGAHGPNESIPIKEILQAARLYGAFLLRYGNHEA